MNLNLEIVISFKEGFLVWMKNKISYSVVSEANLNTNIDLLGAIITKFFGAVKVYDALDEKEYEKKWIK